MNDVVAHQRRIREDFARHTPREVAPNLNGYRVAPISRLDAKPIILTYEWLGSLGRTTVFVGLVSPRGEIEGAACFGHGPGGDIGRVIGEGALCLERGACVHYAPRNAASFLINRACKLVQGLTGTDRFYAYGDPMAGEYGAVYQAAGWVYLGQGLDNGKERPLRRYVLPPGADANDPSAWKTTRELRRPGQRLSQAEAAAKGWTLAWRPGKHVYATHVGRDRKRWLAALTPRPYPAPRPSLKIKAP
jgi:hypothetical protein